MGKNKLASLNKITKAQILSATKELAKTAKKTEVEERIKGIIPELSKQLPSSSMDIIKTDYIILSYLKEIESDIAAESFTVAKIRLDNVYAQLTLRDNYSKDTATKLKDKLEKADNKKIKKIIKLNKQEESFLDVDDEAVKVSVDERYLEDQMIDILLTKARAQLEALNDEGEKLSAQKDGSVNDHAIRAKLIQLNTRKKFASDVANLKRTAISKALKNMTEEQKQTIVNSTFSNEHYNLLLAALNGKEETTEETE